MKSTAPTVPDSLTQLARAFARFTVRDLTHTLEEGIPYFPTHSRFYHLDATRPDDQAIMFQLLMHEHNGTHVDAPAHYLDGMVVNSERHFIHCVNPDALIGIAVVVDVSNDPPHLLQLESIVGWEQVHGPIMPDDAVIFNFGWHRRWSTGQGGSRFTAHWPGINRSLAEYLLERRVRAVGTDCMGLDCSGSADSPAHSTLLKNGILIMENLANLDGLSSRIFLLAAPLKIRDGSASPIRAIAFIPG